MSKYYIIMRKDYAGLFKGVGVWKVLKNGYVIFECSLITKAFHEENPIIA